MATASMSIIEQNISLSFSIGYVGVHNFTTRVTAPLTVPANCVAIDVLLTGLASLSGSSSIKQVRIVNQAGTSLHTSPEVMSNFDYYPPSIMVAPLGSNSLSFQTKSSYDVNSTTSNITGKVRYYVSNL